MKIQLDHSNRYDQRPQYFGDRSRYSTVTSVRFLAPGTIACANFIEREIYLIEYDLAGESFQIAEKNDTRGRSQKLCRHRPAPTESLDFDANRGLLAASHFSDEGVSFYKCSRGRLEFERFVSLSAFGPLHGAKFFTVEAANAGVPLPDGMGGEPYVPDDLMLVAATFPSNPQAGVYLVDIGTGTARLSVLEPSWSAKDACLVPLSGGASAASTGVGLLTIFVDTKVPFEPAEPGNSKVCLHRLDFADARAIKCDEVVMPRTTTDACDFHDGQAFVTMETESDGGVVAVFGIEQAAHSLVDVGHVGGYDFPHGIDVFQDQIAVTEYGACAVHVEELAGFMARLV